MDLAASSQRHGSKKCIAMPILQILRG